MALHPCFQLASLNSPSPTALHMRKKRRKKKQGGTPSRETRAHATKKIILIKTQTWNLFNGNHCICKTKQQKRVEPLHGKSLYMQQQKKHGSSSRQTIAHVCKKKEKKKRAEPLQWKPLHMHTQKRGECLQGKPLHLQKERKDGTL